MLSSSPPAQHGLEQSKATAADILVLTQYDALAEYLGQHLNQRSYAVSAAANLQDGLQWLQQRRSGVIVLDWFDKGHSSLTLCKQIRLANPEVYVVMLIPTGDLTRQRISALDAGADDYLVKPLWLDELDARLRAYFRRIGTTKRDIYRFADLTLDRYTREVYRGNHLISLTAKEFDLLKYLLRHQQQVMTRDQILEHVWGYDFAGDSNIIEVYIRYLRLKLEAHNPTRLIHTVRYVGYVIREPR